MKHIDLVSTTVMLPLKYNGWGEVSDSVGDHALTISVDVNHEIVLNAINSYDSVIVELAFAMNYAITAHMSIDIHDFSYQKVHDELFVNRGNYHD